MPETALPARPLSRAIPTTATLAFVAGFVDVVGFVALFGLFTSHVTGNFIVLGSEIVHASSGGVAKLLALPVFAGVVAIIRLVVLHHERRAWQPARTLLIIETVMLTLFMLAGVAVYPVADPDALGPVLAGMTGVAAMAVQNAASRLVFTNHAPTTIMTGNTTQAVIDLIDMQRSEPDLSAKARERLKLMLPGIAAFATGAIAGAYGYIYLSFWCLVLPIAGLVGVTLLASTWAGQRTAG
jgi:uncharacterized membrane protein YoaK (UPF0700 family)